MDGGSGCQRAKHFVQLRQCQQCLVRGEIGLPLNLITASLPSIVYGRLGLHSQFINIHTFLSTLVVLRVVILVVVRPDVLLIELSVVIVVVIVVVVGSIVCEVGFLVCP